MRGLYMRKDSKLIILPVLLLAISSCGNNNASEPEKPLPPLPVIDEHYYENITDRVSFDTENANNFVDDITNGLDDNVWYTLDGFWENGGEPGWHNGVRRRNLFYTKDENNNGYLAMKARGRYDTSDPSINGKTEGACIETKAALGPGRYEVEMACMPRPGGVSAFWTYACPSGSEDLTQYEIDIEVGGEGQFTNLWSTTWVKKSNKGTKNTDVSDILFMNDGHIHKYTFDWYTDYVGRNETRIDWFIDEHFIVSLDKSAIPINAMPLWLGLWLPSWGGASEFEYDYLLVDKVSYQAFDPETQYYTPTRINAGYSPKAPSNSNIESIPFSSIKNLNKINNAGCESLAERTTNDHYGWKKSTNFDGTIELSNDHTEGEHSFKLTSVGEGSEHDSRYYQDLDCAYKGYEYDLSFDAKIDEGSTATLQLSYRSINKITVLKTETINITSTSFQNYTKHVVMPAGSGLLKIWLKVENGSAYYDNFNLVKTN